MWPFFGKAYRYLFLGELCVPMTGQCRTATLLFAMAMAASLAAQVVNIEGRRFVNDTVPWAGVVDFRYHLTENTQRSYMFGLADAVQHVRGKHRYLVITDLAASRVESNSFLNTGFQHLRYNYAWLKRWTGEAFAQAQYNKPLHLDLRATLGAGPRLRVVNEEDLRMHVGTSLMLEHERTTDGESFVHGRNSSYLAVTLRFSHITSFTTVVYYQPKLFAAWDHRIAMEAGLLLSLTSRYTVESRLNLLRDTAQPTDVPGFTYGWNNRFGIRF